MPPFERNPMKPSLPAAPMALALALSVVSCGITDPKVTREAVLPLLQKEAETMKAEAEKPDPKFAPLGVKNTWTIAGVEIHEQAGNKAQPFKGTIQFRIDSEMREFDGTPLKRTLERKFNYVYDTAAKKWQLVP
jgi:hypothetical protein